MGISIGFINDDKIDWRKPDSAFWGDNLWEYSYDDYDGSHRLFLKDIKQSANEYIETLDDEQAIKSVREFVQECEGYWQERGFGESESISIKIDS